MHKAAEKIAALRRAAAAAPEYAAIIPFFIELFSFIEKNGHRTGITVRNGAEHRKEKLANGFHLVSPDCLEVDYLACATFLHDTIGVLKRTGRDGSGDLQKISAAIDDDRLDLTALFTAILERNRRYLDDSAKSVDIPPPLLEYVLEIPLKTSLELFAASVSQGDVSSWHESNCPVCGSRAGMAELTGEEGKRYLSCSTCSFSWPFKRLACPFCGSDSAEDLSYFLAGEGATRVDTCSSCSRYIKTRDSRNGNTDVPLDVEDILTIHLDLLASREGFERGK